MKRLAAGAVVTLISATALAAPSASETAITASRTVADQQTVIRGSDVPLLTVYQWERNGTMLHAWPDEKKVVPYDASVVSVKLYNFPTGQLRLLSYKAGVRSAWHLNEDDIVMYNLAGMHQIEYVGDKVFDGRAGDATMHPGGMRHHTETLSTASKVEFAFAPQGRSGVDLLADTGVGKTVQTLAETVVDGHRVVHAASAGGAGVYTARTYAFPGYTLVEARYPRGEQVALHENGAEKLAYVVSGRLRVTSGATSTEVGPGDLLRLAAGRPFAREALEDSVLLEVDGSRAPQGH